MVSLDPTAEGTQGRGIRAWAAAGRNYVVLTKPRIIELLLVTTLPTMFVARRGVPPFGLVVATLVGGTLAAGGANALNMVADRDIDRLMRRTQQRPLVTGEVSAAGAAVFALILEALAFLELWFLVNLLSAGLALAATAFYLFVYTLWLKRTSTQNIVIGGAAGAVPVLVGWAAVTNRVGWPAVVLFALIFLWTPPHFWALAVRYADDYRAAGVPMLPAVTTLVRTANQILVYTVLLVSTSFVFGAVGQMGVLYLIAAAVLGARFILFSLRLRRQPTPQTAIGLFHYSILYLALLFAAMAADVLVR